MRLFIGILMGICLVILSIVLLIGSSYSDTKELEVFVNEFHKLYQQGNYKEIYKNVSDEMKEKGGTEQQFIDFMSETKENYLGEYKNTTLYDTKFVNSLFGKKKVTLSYHSEFSLLNVNEFFYFIDTPTGLKLRSYTYSDILE